MIEKRYAENIVIMHQFNAIAVTQVTEKGSGLAYVFLRQGDTLGAAKKIQNMRYKLSFLDAAGSAREVCISDFEEDSTAILWMRVVGAERSLHPGWSTMELSCGGRQVARIAGDVLRRVWERSRGFGQNS